MSKREVTLLQIKAKDLQLGDVVARSSGQITDLEFLPVHELRRSSDGRIMFLQKSKNGTTVVEETLIWIVKK